MMFDQQQKTTNSLLNKQNLDITSPDEPAFSLEDIDVSILEGSDNNTQFPSKISQIFKAHRTGFHVQVGTHGFWKSDFQSPATTELRMISASS